MNQKNRNAKPQHKKEDISTVLASAAITHGKDTPILQEDLPSEFEQTTNNVNQTLLSDGKWVRFFDNSDTFLKGLMALVNNSTTLRNILNQKTTLSLGDGFIPFEADKTPYLQTFRNFLKKIFGGDGRLDKLNDFIGNVNFNNETLEDVIRKVFFDYWAFGNAFVEFVDTTRDSKPIVMIYHIPIHQVGIKKVDETNIITHIGVSNDWEINQGTTAVEIPIYPVFEEVGKVKRSAVHIKNYSPGFFYWGLPSNIASRFYAELEYRIPKYNISKFKNGFVSSGLLQFFGNMTSGEAKTIIENFTAKFTDTGNNGKIFAQVLSDEKYKAHYTPLEDKNDGSYMDLQKIASQGIVTGNEFTMGLSGFATTGKLGTNQQMRDELDYVTNTTIKPARRRVLQVIINPLIIENQRVGALDKGIMLGIANMNPISLSSQIDPNQVLLTSEKREVLGFDALDEAGKAELNFVQQPITPQPTSNGNSNNAN
jgi:hypothetical protein